jgi:zinc protease
MFKSTKNQKSENFDRLTEDVGGANNAFTQEDATVYHETVPSNYLEPLLWAEADRMANLSVNEANFVSERAVVEEEYRQSILANPYGRLEGLYVDQKSFVAHPYQRGVIGSIADLDSATLEDVRKFHQTYYRPDNATLIVSGDFDPGQLDVWVDKYFGRIAKPTTEIPRVTVIEPARTKEARFNTTGPNVPLPASAITYLLPPRKSDDADALRIAEVILGRGESSRLNQSLVYRQQIAASASANADLRDDAGLFELTVITAGGKSGADAETAALADFTASVLTRGTRTHTAPQIAETVEALGGSLSSAAGWDGANVSLSSLSSRLGDALPMFAEVLRAPAFAQEEIERLRSENLDALAVSLRAPGTLARLTAARVVFGESGYGHSPNGTPETMKALDAREINRFYQSRYQPQNTVLVFGGDITPDAAFAYASKYFGDWKALHIAALPAPRPAVPEKSGRVVVVDKPDAGQAAVCVARPTIRRADQQYAIGRVANGVLGEGFSSRLNQEVRIKRGLSYGASSGLGARKASGFFTASAQTRNDAAPEVASLLKAELARLATEPVAAAELVPRKAALSGNYARELETGAGLVSAVVSLTAFDLPLSSLNDDLPRVQKVTVPQIQRFASKHLAAAGASVIIVGDGRQFLPELKKRFPNVEVIPVDKLDLNKAGLVKP